MAKKKFDIGYTMVVYCTVRVEAESKEEAEELFDDGYVETSLDRDTYDSDCFGITYIKEAEDN